MSWQLVAGLEVHVQLTTATKMFCSTPTGYGEPVNTLVCPVCLGLPGALPRINEKAVTSALRIARVLQCEVDLESRFDRKHYFYPDLPKGYQITQYHRPLAGKGTFTIDVDGETMDIAIDRLHLEEDAGKLTHEDRGPSRIDYNRAGTPLVEIVTEPDFNHPAQVEAFLVELRTLVRYLDVSNGNMDEGSLRCDVNVSIARPAKKNKSTRVEVKNLNSFRHVVAALEWEYQRQIALVEDGCEVIGETRLFDETTGETRAMRTKEETADYRYMAEPDLAPLVLPPDWWREIDETIPELARSRRLRYQSELSLSLYDAQLLTEERDLATYFEAVLENFHSPKEVANWLLNEVKTAVHRRETTIGEIPLSPPHLAELAEMVHAGEISRKLGRELLDLVIERGEAPRQLAKRENLLQVSDDEVLAALVEEAVEARPKVAEKVRQGQLKALSALVGYIMSQNRQANPQKVKDLLEKRLAR